MHYLTVQMVVDILNELPRIFDAHDAERKAIGMFPREVGRELARQSNRGVMSALQKFSMQYSRFIEREFGSPSVHPQIRKTRAGPNSDGRVESSNLAGDLIVNQQWEKRVPRIIAPAH